VRLWPRLRRRWPKAGCVMGAVRSELASDGMPKAGVSARNHRWGCLCLGRSVRKLSDDELALAAPPDTGLQHIAGLMRQVRPQAFDETNRRERSVQ